MRQTFVGWLDTVTWGVVLLVFTGCTYSKSFGCKGYPEGVRCQDVLTVYEQRHDGPGSLAGPGSSPAPSAPAVTGIPEVVLGQPLLAQPQVVRVWLAPWEDTQHRLHEASLVYVMVQESSWAYGRGVSTGGPRSSGQVLTPIRSDLTESPRRARDTRAPSSPAMANPAQTVVPEALKSLQQTFRRPGGGAPVAPTMPQANPPGPPSVWPEDEIPEPLP